VLCVTQLALQLRNTFLLCMHFQAVIPPHTFMGMVEQVFFESRPTVGSLGNQATGLGAVAGCRLGFDGSSTG